MADPKATQFVRKYVPALAGAGAVGLASAYPIADLIWDNPTAKQRLLAGIVGAVGGGLSTKLITDSIFQKQTEYGQKAADFAQGAKDMWSHGQIPQKDASAYVNMGSKWARPFTTQRKEQLFPNNILGYDNQNLSSTAGGIGTQAGIQLFSRAAKNRNANKVIQLQKQLKDPALKGRDKAQVILDLRRAKRLSDNIQSGAFGDTWNAGSGFYKVNPLMYSLLGLAGNGATGTVSSWTGMPVAQLGMFGANKAANWAHLHKHPKLQSGLRFIAGQNKGIGRRLGPGQTGIRRQKGAFTLLYWLGQMGLQAMMRDNTPGKAPQYRARPQGVTQ